MVANIFVIGLLNGCVYALLAAGFSLLFSVARVLNLSYTSYWMLVAYCFFWMTVLGVPVIVAALIAIAAVVLFSMVVHKLLIGPVGGVGMSVMILTIAIGAIIEKAVSLFQNALGGRFFQLVPSLIGGGTKILGVAVTYQYLLSLFVVIVVLIGLWLFLSKTRYGIAVRAISEDREIAGLMGINEKSMMTMINVIAVAVAAIAGVVVSPLYVLEPWMWMNHLLVLMAVVIFGGIGSFKGSIIAAFTIAFIETTVVFLMPAGGFLRSAICMLILILVLLIRPKGLFGVLIND